jgi:hypothetical protein
MSSFLTVEELVVDDVYRVVGYKKFYYMGYNYVIKMTKDEGVSFKYMFIVDGPICDKLNSGCTTRFNIKKADIELGNNITQPILINVEDSGWNIFSS